MAIPRSPAGTGPAGRRLWREVLAEFELSGADLILLAEACHTLDSIESLKVAAGDKTTVRGATGAMVIAPEIREIRAQKIVLARILAALRVIAGEDGEFERGRQRVGFRGVYGGLHSVDSEDTG